MVRALTSAPAIAVAVAFLGLVAFAGALKRKRRRAAVVAPVDAPKGGKQQAFAAVVPQAEADRRYVADDAVAEPRAAVDATAVVPFDTAAAADDFDDIFAAREAGPCEETAVVPISPQSDSSDWDSDDDDGDADNPLRCAAPLSKSKRRAGSLSLLGSAPDHCAYRRLATL